MSGKWSMNTKVSVHKGDDGYIMEQGDISFMRGPPRMWVRREGDSLTFDIVCNDMDMLLDEVVQELHALGIPVDIRELEVKVRSPTT